MTDALFENDLPSAARNIEQGLALDQANLDGITTAARIANWLGRREQSVGLAKYAVLRDPVNIAGLENLATAYALSGISTMPLNSCGRPWR